MLTLIVLIPFLAAIALLTISLESKPNRWTEPIMAYNNVLFDENSTKDTIVDIKANPMYFASR